MNLVIPIAGNSKFFNSEEYGYPKPLIEILGITMIELVIKNITIHNTFKQIIFIVKQDECDQFKIDRTLKLLSPVPPKFVKLKADTQGALCSTLLAIEYINNDDPLLISNADQIFDGGVAHFLSKFLLSNLDAGCITFNSIHPRWSYVRANEEGLVLEAAEKNPISRHAIAGIYFYKKGSDFIKHGMSSINFGNSVNGKFYLAPVFNEFILAGQKVGHYPISNNDYHTFYTPQKINEYESAATFSMNKHESF